MRQLAIFAVFISLTCSSLITGSSYLPSDRLKFTSYAYTFTNSIESANNSLIGTVYFSNSTVHNAINFEFTLVSVDANRSSAMYRAELTRTGLAIRLRQDQRLLKQQLLNSSASTNNAASFLKVYAIRRTDQAIVAKCYVIVRTLAVDSSNWQRVPPAFTRSSYEAQLYENNAPDTRVIRVEAVGANYGHITYHLVNLAASSLTTSGGVTDLTSAFSALPPFQIKSDTGEIYVRRTLNREQRDVYTLTVLAVESGPDAASRLNATVQVSIRVMQQSEAIRPRVLETATVINISITETIDHTKRPEVFNAAERLAGRQQLTPTSLVYSLTGSLNDLNTFEMDSRTGRVHLVAKLNAELRSTYRLGVVARDLSVPASAAAVTLVINVEVDTARVAPTFHAAFYEFILYENATVGQRVGRVSAYYLPKSSIRNKFIQYEITGMIIFFFNIFLFFFRFVYLFVQSRQIVKSIGVNCPNFIKNH
jgi:hypothetical protein